jgi:hypothetical protein
MEKYLTEDEIMHRIKMQKSVTKEDRDFYYFDLKIMNLTDKGKERHFKPIVKNQERNKIKYGKKES